MARHCLRPYAAVIGAYLALNLQANTQNDVLTHNITGDDKAPHWPVVERVHYSYFPIAEQQRIVAKVDQLVALVDQLEMQLATSRATAEKLMKVLVAELAAQQGTTSRNSVYRRSP